MILGSSHPTHGSLAGLEYLFSGFCLIFGLFFVATSFVPRLHQWMLDDELYSQDVRTPPG
jgi:hypothetical protein